MLIDWFTVVAQIVNFVVLVALLKRFLWGPLVAAIDAREQKIAARVAEAARSEKDAAARVEQLAKEAAEIEQSKADILAAARSEGDRKRGEILDQARAEVKELENRWHSELAREKTVFLDEVRRCAAAEILVATRAALHDLASADVQNSAVSAFTEKLRAMDPAVLRTFAANRMTVVSHDDLPPELRDRVVNAVADRLGEPVEVRFERAPTLSWGVELRANGRRIGWTPDAWVDSVEDKLRAALETAAANGNGAGRQP